jgi:hypothetical protein
VISLVIYTEITIMSCEQRSSGTLFLGKSASVKVRIVLAKKLIEHEQKVYDRAVSLWNDKTLLKTLKDMIKKDGNDYAATRLLEERFNPPIRDHYGYNVNGINYLKLSPEEDYAVIDKLLKGLKPTKKEIVLTTVSHTSFSNDGLSIAFNHNTGDVTWSVSKGNRAHDHAMASTLGNAFMKIMNAHAWTPKTGGVIYYRDEYADEHIDSQARIVSQFGGAGKRAADAEWRPRRTVRRTAR